MPLYEYNCRACEAKFELLIRGSEEPRCPHCDSNHLDKLLSVPAAPAGRGQELPTCRPMPGGGCGLPQCGQGGCGIERGSKFQV